MKMPDRVILVVEDNPDDQLLIVRALKQHHIANDIVTAGDGEEALEYLHGTGRYAGRNGAGLPQVVLLDLHLPKIDGLQVLQNLRGTERTRMLPVVVLTTSDEDRDIVDSYRFGANSFVRKPVDFGEFTGAVQHLGLFWMLLNKTVP